jgi:uncharacterized membrane protein YbaN (DUF454 family)
MVALRLILGVCFFLLGIAGIFLPILQAWLFFLLAAAMFFPQHRLVHKLTTKAHRTMPRTAALLRKLGIGE